MAHHQGLDLGVMFLSETADFQAVCKARPHRCFPQSDPVSDGECAVRMQYTPETRMRCFGQKSPTTKSGCGTGIIGGHRTQVVHLAHKRQEFVSIPSVYSEEATGFCTACEFLENGAALCAIHRENRLGLGCMNTHAMLSQGSDNKADLRAKCFQFVKAMKALTNMKIVGEHGEVLRYPVWRETCA